jgi:hypothetical protein
MKTKFQIAILSRLEHEFFVDVTPAAALAGEDLDIWLFAAEDELFSRLMQERTEALAQGGQK